MKKFAMLIAFLGLLAIVGCGKVSRTEPFPDSGYPHSYPQH